MLDMFDSVREIWLTIADVVFAIGFSQSDLKGRLLRPIECVAKKVTFQTVRDEPNREYHRVDDESYFTTTPGQIKHLQFSLQYLTPYPNGVVWLTEDLNSTEPLDFCQADSLF